MKLLFTLTTLCLLSCGQFSIKEEDHTVNKEISLQDEHHHDHKHHDHGDAVHYDAVLAEELGADEYGMRQYVIAFLKSGPHRNQSEEEANQMQVAHLQNIQRLADEGILVLAGPFMEDSDLRGLYVFDVKTKEEARALTATDPMIESGRLIMELHPWYGSAALKKVNEIHNQIQSINISTEE